MNSIGIDVGGTNLRLGIVDSKGRVLFENKVQVGSKRGQSDIVQLISDQIQSIQHRVNQTINLVGIGIPGIVNSQKGIVYSSPHFPAWKNFKVRDILQKKIKKKVVIDNDANMIALGEMSKGSGKGWGSFLMLTLGTGIGGGIIINKNIFHGTNGFAGEFGHVTVEPNGPHCNCGGRGCLEKYASATGLVYLRSKFKVSDKKLYEMFGYYLGIGLASIVNVTGIQKIVLGGGISNAHRLFLKAAKKEMAKRIYRKTMDDVEIRLSKLGDNAGIIGAALCS